MTRWLMILAVASCASDDARTYDCTLVFMTSGGAGITKDSPCLSPGNEDAWRAQWVADVCADGQSCSATCEPTTTTCEP